MNFDKLDFTIAGHKFDVSEVIRDVVPFIVAFGGLVGINLDKYKDLFNELVNQLHTDISTIHGLGWGAIILAVVQVFMRNRVQPPVDPTKPV